MSSRRFGLFSFGSRGDSALLAALALELQTRGHNPLLVTEYAEYRQLGFRACDWEVGSARKRPLDQVFSTHRKKHLTAEVPIPFRWLSRRMLVQIAAFIPMLMGRIEVRQMMQYLSRRELLVHIALNAPLLVIVGFLFLLHLATIPLLIIFNPGCLQSPRNRLLTKYPSLIDIGMIVDGILRPHWKPGGQHSASFIQRCFHQNQGNLQLDRLLELVNEVVAQSDIVVLAEGTDDPLRERIVLFAAARHRVPAVSASGFPRLSPPNKTFPNWMVVASFPFLMRSSCRLGLLNWLTHWFIKPYGVLLRLLMSVCDHWYCFVQRRLAANSREDVIELINKCLPGSPTHWREFLSGTYALRLETYSAAVFPAYYMLPCGFWPMAGTDETISTTLRSFLDSGGSIVMINRVIMSPGMQEMVRDVLAIRSELKIILQAEPAQILPELRQNPRVFCAADIPHSLVFPLLDGTVHHAGAQTVLTVLRSGVPSLPIATWGDQVLWSQRLHALGVSVCPLHVRWVSSGVLAQRIDELLLSRDLKQKSLDMAEAFKKENGFPAAIDSMLALTGDGPESRLASD